MQSEGDLLPKDKVGNYDEFIKDKYENLKNYKDNNNVIDNILGKKGKELLYSGTVETPDTSARDAFAKYLSARVLPEENTNFQGGGKDPVNDAVSLEKLLGKDGLKLYKAAIKEEQQSKEFRNAVFIKCLTHHDGDKWSERAIIWAGGPSASGKSFASKEIINQINKNDIMKKSDNDTSGNLIVAIDGGVEREVSQMRRLVLEVAKAKGYPGISDLHKNTKLDVKKHIRKAVMEEGNKEQINLYIPATFTNPLGVKNIFRYNKLKNTKQIFSEIVPPKGQEKYFQEITESQGVKRAFLQPGQYGKDKTSDKIDIDHIESNRNIESKEYEKKYFKIGTKMSNLAAFIYKKTSKDNINIKVVNDQICAGYNVETKKWEKCSPKDPSKTNKVLLSQRDFNEFKKELDNTPQKTLDLKNWYEDKKKNKQTAQPLVEINKNGKILSGPKPPPLLPKPKTNTPPVVPKKPEALRQRVLAKKKEIENAKTASIELTQSITPEKKSTNHDTHSRYTKRPEISPIAKWHEDVKSKFEGEKYTYNESKHYYTINKKNDQTVSFDVHPTKITASLDNKTDEEMKKTIIAMFEAFEKLHPGETPKINFPNSDLKEKLSEIVNEVLTDKKFQKWAPPPEPEKKEAIVLGK